LNTEGREGTVRNRRGGREEGRRQIEQKVTKVTKVGLDEWS
jgi:hypothetical protein